MAESALEFLTLAEAKSQLDLDDDPDSTAYDARVTRAVKSAVSYVAHRTGRPLIERSLTVDAPRIGTALPLMVPLLDIKTISAVKYWSVDQELREEAAGSIEPGTLGRRKETLRATAVWAPEGGWPEILRDSTFEVTATIGFDIDEHSEDLKDAVILMMRHYFEKPDLIESDFAVMALIGPWIRWSKIV